MANSRRIAVIGTGYVGLVSGACLAEIGHEVVCVDHLQSKIDMLNRHEIPIYEPGLQPIVQRNHEAGKLRFTSDLTEAVKASDIVFVAVGTPASDSGDADMTQVWTAIRQIAAAINSYKLVVIKSTVPVGTGRHAETMMREHAPLGSEFDVVSNPEFLREGTAVYDTFHMDRIVIGAENERAASMLREALEPFQAPVLLTNRESSELIKYASNSFLATKISFINEIANVCEKVGADVSLVAKGMGMDKRIGPSFLNAGIGYGGFCLPKDTRAQLRIAENVDYDFKIMRAVIEVNQLQRRRYVDKVRTALGGELSGAKLAVMGVAFKPNTDDMRDAPSLDIVSWLQEEGAKVYAYDPVASERAAALMPGAIMCDKPEQALDNADAMLVLTEWEQVKELQPAVLRRLMKRTIVVDGRNVYDPNVMAAEGFAYYSIGRAAREL